jgi:hypothetical protein
VVTALRLYTNVPNPFNPMTRITFDVARTGPVDLSVFDVAGRLVTTLVHGPLGPGRHQVEWNGVTGRGVHAASGTYFYTLRQGREVETRRMVLIK